MERSEPLAAVDAQSADQSIDVGLLDAEFAQGGWHTHGDEELLELVDGRLNGVVYGAFGRDFLVDVR